MRIYCMLGGKKLYLVISVFGLKGVSLFLVKMPFCFSFSLLFMALQFVPSFSRKIKSWKKRGYREIGMLLYLYLDGTKMITFLLACLYVLCQMPATDTAGIALFSPPLLPFLFFFSWKWNSFCNSSDSPVTLRRGSRVLFFGFCFSKKPMTKVLTNQQHLVVFQGSLWS